MSKTISAQQTEMVKFSPKVKYSDYKATVYIGMSVKLDLNSSPWAKRFRTVLKNGYKSGVNFAGHYCLVYWGCGSPCQQSAIIDVLTGKIYSAPDAANGYEFKANSRMLIVNPPDSNSYYMKDVFWAIPDIQIFNESTKTFKRKK